MQCTVAAMQAMVQKGWQLWERQVEEKLHARGLAKQAEKRGKAMARAMGKAMGRKVAGAREGVGTPNAVIVAELPTITRLNAGA